MKVLIERQYQMYPTESLYVFCAIHAIQSANCCRDLDAIDVVDAVYVKAMIVFLQCVSEKNQV